MSKGDAVERMLDEIGRRRRPDESLAMTALEVFHEEEEISDIELDSLAICGYTAVLSEEGAWPVAPSSRWPEECPPSICQLLDADVSPEQLDPRKLSGEDTAMLAIVGLWTICGEHFMNADASN